MMVFLWQRGVMGLSRNSCRLDFFLFGGRVEVYGVPLYAKKPIVYYLYFHSNIAYCRSSTLE